MSRIFFVWVIALATPLTAAADYLYGLNKESGVEPYVLFIADNSGSMVEADVGSNCCICNSSEDCLRKCWNKPRCETRIDALKDTLKSLIPTLDNVVLGLAKYGNVSGAITDSEGSSCRAAVTNPLPVKSGDKPPTQAQLLNQVNGMKADGWTPIGLALEQGLRHLKSVQDNDTSGHCRPYAVVLLTDGIPQCDNNSRNMAEQAERAKRGVQALKAAGIPTYVVGFGKDVKGNNLLNELARLGGTARAGDTWCGSCASGGALFPEDAAQLREALEVTFEEIRRGQYTVAPPMVGTVPQEKSEYDRVSNNFMIYTSFEVPDYKGRIYGIRLFEEAEEKPGVWEFTDLTEDNEDFSLTDCGREGNPCVFEAGSILQSRTKPRNIFFSVPTEVETEAYQLVLTMGSRITPQDNASWQSALRTVAAAVVGEDSPLRPGVDALGEAEREFLTGMAKSVGDELGREWRQHVRQWIDGTGRPWRLGDMYHSAVAIVTTPPYTYRGYGYPVFKSNYRNRPPMIYVGANDGQIHAFHAADDHFHDEKEQPRWRAGEEAWSYVPFNMFAKVSLAALANQTRVWSQDLSCRVDDVVAHPTVAGEGEIDCSLDPDHEERGTCGWRTVLICGQGWGGSWYVALDVTDPFDPRPMWEATHLGNGKYGLGRTWAVPSVGPVNLEVEKDGKKIGVPTWLAIYGSGYNTLHQDYEGNVSAAYRYLNMPFAGPYPEHGAGIQGEKDKVDHSFIFVQDVVTGKYHKYFPVPNQYGITADIPLVGTNDRFHINVGYFGGWEGGKMGRIYLPPDANGLTRPELWGICKDPILAFSQSKPLTSRPSAYSDPYKPNEIYLFVGSGLDPGTDPDQQANQGKMWEFQAFKFEDDGTSNCPKVNNPNLCTKGEVLKNIFNDGGRLISPPTLSVKRDLRKWLVFTTWKPGQGGGCGDGTSYLYCLDVTDEETCHPCGSHDGDDEGSFVRKEIGGQKAQTPVTADDQIYVIGEKGPVKFNTETKGEGTPNQGAPRAMVLSWREIF